MITNFGYPNAKTYAGDITSKDSTVVGGVACVENIPFGSVVGFIGTTCSAIQAPAPNKVTFDINFEGSNVINANVTIKTLDANNKEVITTTAISPVTYATSNANTYALLKAAIEAVDTDSKLTATIDASAKTVVLTHSDNFVVYLSGVAVTAGTNQAVATYSFSGTLLGPVPKATVERDSNGVAQYTPGMICPWLEKGSMYITSIDAMTLASSVYVQFIDNDTTKRGALRTGTDSGKAMAFSSLVPDSTVSAGELANMKINKP